MEELLQGLNCSLRVSGKIGDSIMMGIISAAMEEAYERILCSREGGLECLNDKSRFCGLAIMQLEWCLWFLEEEMDACGVESDDERQELISDLRATRDRIRRRLEETESAIADKEKELVGMSERESELRRALESKDEELHSLRASLGHDRARRSSPPKGGTVGNGGEAALSELKSIIIHQLDGLSCELTEGEAHLSDAIQRLGEEDDACENFSDRGETGQNSYAKNLRNLARRNVEKLFKKLSLGMSILRRRLLLTFEVAEEAIFFSEVAGDEQQLLHKLEDETLHILLENFLRDVNENDAPAFINGNSGTTIMEELGQVFLNPAAEDIRSFASVAFEGSGEEYLPCLSSSLQVPWISDEGSTAFTLEGLLPSLNSETMEPQIYQAEPLDDEAFWSVRSKLEKALQQIAMSRMQLRELGSDLGVPLDEKEHAVDDIIRQEKEETSSVSMQNRENQWGEIQSVITHLTCFSQDILDLLGTVCAKVQENMSRLEGLNCQLNLLVQQASSLRGTELVYRKAFIRRCYNLQIAEAEVDLLGDEVDTLIGLLEKIYLVLDYYSPVLQYYNGIMGILKMIKKELFGDVSAGSHK
ncbi:unnamed protein product [Spirodela intermedia]|uniref:Uncharacterized protein n=1 Tax=Spirodela intermedia TaxID=51605 RepID=A0A7I8K9H8_SPIIN|nr:unnamed protein product [Spirodela intermedia]